jgi:hypothetical protein
MAERLDAMTRGENILNITDDLQAAKSEVDRYIFEMVVEGRMPDCKVNRGLSFSGEST